MNDCHQRANKLSQFVGRETPTYPSDSRRARSRLRPGFEELRRPGLDLRRTSRRFGARTCDRQ
jgi:hypothetical protein